jgi:hypothetical protein
MIIKINTLKNLQEFLNGLTPEQLSQKVFYTEEQSHTITEVEILEYDVFVNKHDVDEFGTIEELKENLGEDFDIENYIVATPKGTIFMQ